MATIELYRTGKRTNSTLRPKFVAGDSYESNTCQFFEPLDILNPTIIMREEAMPNLPHDLCKYNYVYIQSPLERYYWITKWTRQDGLWYAECTVDYLGSWRNTILESEQYITRSSIVYNNGIPDNFYDYRCDNAEYNSLFMPSFANRWKGIGNDEYVPYGIILRGNWFGARLQESMGTLDTKYDLPAISIKSMNTLLTILSNLKSKADTSLVALSKFVNSVYFLPFAVNTNENNIVYVYYGDYKDAKAAGFDDGASTYGKTWDRELVAYSANEGNMGNLIAESKKMSFTFSVNIKDYKSSIDYENSSAYTDMAIEFQPFGFIKINPDLFIKSTLIEVEVIVDVLTGDAVLKLQTPKGYQTIANGNVAVPILLTSYTNNSSDWRRSQISNITMNATQMIAGAGTAIAGGMSGNALAAIGGLMNVAKGITRIATLPPMTTGGSTSGASGSSIIDNGPNLHIWRRKITDRDDARFGRPLCEKRILGSQLTGATAANNYKITNPGYILCQDAQIKSGTGIEIGTTMLSTERAAIETAMNGGIYLE